MIDLPQAPDLTLTAVGTERAVSMRAPGLTTVLICLAQETQKDADVIEAAVRDLWPDPQGVLVAHVVDLRKIPGLFHKVAEGVLASEHRKAVEALAPGQEPYDHVVILPDWQGEVATALDLPDPSKTICGAVLTADGLIAGRYEGVNVANVTMLVDSAIGL